MNSQIDAYRYFFPVGWLVGLWGVFLWVLFPRAWVSYPGLQHPDLMVGGFFLCFIAGFLMTAIPRFTDTFGPSRREQFFAMLWCGFLLLAALFFRQVYFYALVFCLFVFLLRYGFIRFRRRKGNPPPSFVFLAFGLGAGTLGSLILLITQISSVVPGSLQSLARLFFLQAYVLCLVVGVGSRLVPALLGFAPLPTESRRFKSPDRSFYSILGILFLTTYLLENFIDMRLGYLVRSILLSYILIILWRIYKLPARKAVQTYFIWASAWCVLLGHWGIVFFIPYRIHLLHVILVSGLALMTLMIAVRVSLSHGKHSMMIETKSKALLVAGFLIFLAGFTRLSAGFAPVLYQSHLLYAAWTWILALVIWGAIFIPKMIKVNKP